MAKVIATIGGVALKPGVSKNRRLYTAEHVRKAAARLQQRIADGDAPVAMMSFHQAGDDTRQISATLTSARVDENGHLRYEAGVADTAAGRDIAALADTSDGNAPHLVGVSLKGRWLGTVRRVTAPDGDPAETAGDLEIDTIDFTKSPGVTGAGIDSFSWVRHQGQVETTERVYIYESAPEASVTITEDTAPAEAGTPRPDVTEGLRAMLPSPHVLENGICAHCAPVAEGGDAPGDGSKPYGNTVYADPGYQPDKKKRYPIDSKAHVRAALAYLSQKANAAKYTPAQLKRVMGRIRGAAKKFGITVAAESAGWTFDEPTEVSEALAEYFGDPSCAGSWSVNASNGPVSVCLSSYSMPPEDLDVILRAAADAACVALKALDPDMDGDIDIPGATASDTDHDGGESAPDDEPETETDPAASPAAAINTKEESEMTDATTPAEQAAPALDPKILAEAIAAGLAQHEEARAAREADERKTAEEAAEKAATEAAAQESADARIKRLVAEGIKTAMASEQHSAEIAVATETEDEKIKRLVAEGMVTERQKLAEDGVGTGRKGLTTGAVDEHRAPRTDGGTPDLNAHGMPGTFPDKPAEKLSATELRANAAPYLAAYVFGDRAAKFG